LDVKALQSPPVPDDKDSTFPVWLDLNSEVFFVGFGLGMIFGDKTHSQVASVYLEDCRINGFTTGITSGASAVMENISGVFDRLVPINIEQLPRGLLNNTGVATALNTMLGITNGFTGSTTT